MNKTVRRTFQTLLVSLVAVLACPTSAAEGPRCTEVAPGGSPLRRLTRVEFDNTIADLLGDHGGHAQHFPEEGGSGFDNNADLAVATRIHAQKYLAAAESIAARAAGDLPKLLGCRPEGPREATCVNGWIERFGRRAWRRPLSADERASLVSFYGDQRREHPVADSVRVVLQALLQSPHFLYRVERGQPLPGKPVARLTDHEVASRLSYLLWATMPDERLFRVADRGQLHTPRQIAAEARRMLRDPRSKRTVLRFHEEWLGLGLLDRLQKEKDKFPLWTRELPKTYKAQFERFIDWVMWESDGRLETLLTTPVTFANEASAKLQGFDGVRGERWVLQRAGGERRAGVLTLPGFVAMQAKVGETSPIKRGIFVREHLLCQIPDPPPPNMQMNELPPPSGDVLTVRERLEEHVLDAGCGKCHRMFDPLGLAFEHYDGIGVWRDDEQGRPVDASGELIKTDVDGPFDDVVQLAARLARSQQVRSCLVRQWFRFAYGRTESAADACTLADLERRFEASRHRIPQLLIDLTQTDAFLYRATPIVQTAANP